MNVLHESKSWAIDVPGSSLLRPKILGDKHKPIFKIGFTVDTLSEYDTQIRKGNKLKSNSYALSQLYTKTIILSKQHKGSGTVHLEDLTMSNGHIN